MVAMFSMVYLGFGEIVGSLAIGQVIDRIGSKAVIVISLVLITLQTLLVLIFLAHGIF